MASHVTLYESCNAVSKMGADKRRADRTSLHEGAQTNAHCGADQMQTVVVLCLIVSDIGWVARVPIIGFPAIFVALLLQLRVLWLVLQGRCQSTVYHYVIPVWIIGNLFWMLGEVPWNDSPQVQAALAAQTIPLSYADKVKILWYPRTLFAGSLIMVLTSMLLTTYYLVNLTTSATIRASPNLSHDLYLFPWLLADSTWVLANSIKLLGGPVILLSVTCAGLGLVAIGICGATLVRLTMRRPWQEPCMEAGFVAAEFMWVLGNVEWSVADALNADALLWVRAAIVGTMSCGLFVFCLRGYVCRDDEHVKGVTTLLKPSAVETHLPRVAHV